LKRALNQLVYLFAIPILIGTIGGFSAIAFRKLINLSEVFFQLISKGNQDYRIVFLPFIFLLTYALSKRLLVSPENVTIDEIAGKISAEKGGFNLKKSFLILLLTSFNIGFGVPVGREGPIAKLGGVLSEIYLKLTKTNKLYFPIYLTCGVSSAISATFNAPVAAVLFGIEVVLGRINSYIVIPLVVSSSVSTIISREFLGNFPAFYVPELHYRDSEIPAFLVIAIASALTSTLFLLLLRVFSNFRIIYRHAWEKISFICGFLVGLLILIYPEIAGVGYDSVTKLFQGEFSPDRALEIFIAKFFAVVLSFGSGIFGGMLAPSIFMGAFMGYSLGKLFTIDPRVFALVGSASLLSGISRAPFRSSLIVIELTHNYQLVVPVLMASIVTSYLAGFPNEINFIKRALLHKGINVEEVFKKNLSDLRVENFVKFVRPVYETSHVNLILDRFLNENVRYIPVVKSSKNQTLVGIVSIRDLKLTAVESSKRLHAKDVMTPEPFTVTLEAPLEEILKVIALFEVNLVPVVDESGKYVGMFDVENFLRKLLTPD